MTATVTSWATLAIAFCFLRMLGPGALSFLSGNTLSFWFERRLGAVEGLRQLGMALAMILIPALNLWLVTQVGWRGAYATLGVAIWIVLFPLIFYFFRNGPNDVGQSIDGRTADDDFTAAKDLSTYDATRGLSLKATLRTAAFWIVGCGAMAYGLIHTAVFFCLVPIFQERGLTTNSAAIALSVFAVCLAVSQLVGGMLADRMKAPKLLFVGMAGLSISTAMLYFAESAFAAIAAGGATGVAQGVYFGATHPLWARYFGRRHLGKIRGTLTTMQVACSALGPFFAGATRDWLGSFDLAFVLFILIPLPIALLSPLAKPPKWTSSAA